MEIGPELQLEDGHLKPAMPFTRWWVMGLLNSEPQFFSFAKWGDANTTNAHRCGKDQMVKGPWIKNGKSYTDLAMLVTCGVGWCMCKEMALPERSTSGLCRKGFSPVGTSGVPKVGLSWTVTEVGNRWEFHVSWGLELHVLVAQSFSATRKAAPSIKQ